MNEIWYYDGCEYEDVYSRYVLTFQRNLPPHHSCWYSGGSSSLSRTDSKYLTDHTASYYSNIYRLHARVCQTSQHWSCDGKPNACRVSVSLSRFTSVSDVLPMNCGVRCLAVCYSKQWVPCCIYFLCYVLCSCVTKCQNSKCGSNCDLYLFGL